MASHQKSQWRKALEAQAGTDNPDLTNDQLIQLINNKNNAEYQSAFMKALNEIEDCLLESAIDAIAEKYKNLSDYPPFVKAINLKRQYFKELI